MEPIVAVASELLKSTESFIQFEEGLIPLIAQLVCAAVAQALEAFDAKLCLGKADWQITRKDKRSIQCLFGTVQFERRLVIDASGVQSYPLDQALGISRGRRYSPLFMARVAELSSGAVLRTVAKAVSALTPGSISFQTVGKLYQEVGRDIAEVEQVEAAAKPAPKAERASVPELLIEGDAFETKIKHHQRINVHRLQVSEGVYVNGKRHMLIKRHVISGLDREVVFSRMKAYLDAHYDLAKTLIISGSDNGSGYEPDTFSVFAHSHRGQKQHVHILDVYHLNQKLKQRFSAMPVELKTKLRAAVFSGNWEQVELVMDTAESIAAEIEDQDAAENVTSLRKYLDRNWTSIVPIADGKWRHTGLGSCESNHRAYTYRLKKQGRSWSVDGLRSMLYVIDAVQNNELGLKLSQTSTFDTPQETSALEPVQISADFKLKALFKTEKHLDHDGAWHGVISTQGVASTGLAKLAASLNQVG